MFEIFSIICMWAAFGWVIREALLKPYYPVNKTPLWLDWIMIMLVGPLVWLEAALAD